jgi:hypothetical protein
MQTIVPNKSVKNTYIFEDALKQLGDTVTLHPEGYATDKTYPDIHILPEDMELSVQTQTAKFTNKKLGKKQTIRLLPNHMYIHPSGYKVLVNRHPTIPKWKLTGILSEPTFCHKPSTGKSTEATPPPHPSIGTHPCFCSNLLHSFRRRKERDIKKFE